METNNTSGVPENSGGGNGMWVIAIVVIVLIIIGIIVWKVKSSSTVTVPNETSTETTGGLEQVPGVEATPVAPKTVTVTLTSSGYSPASVTINEGDTVTFVNDSSSTMDTASDPHPTHTDYPGFDEKTAVQKGGTYSFTFTKVGTWGYHNHRNPTQKGTITVVAIPTKG